MRAAAPEIPWKAVIGGSAGNLVEWYDWFVYGSFAVYLAAALFPHGNTTAQVLGTAGIFAAGLFMRPVGGWLLGRFADRNGRTAALTLTVTLMSGSALLIAVAPAYTSAGYAGAVMLLAARLIQGISAGGEYAAGATYLVEIAPRGRRGFVAGVLYASMTAGQLAGLGLLILLRRVLPEEALESYGWRIPFVVGAAGAVVVLFMRRSLVETEAYREEEEIGVGRERGAIRGLLRHRREALLVVALTMGGAVAHFAFATHLTAYLTGTAGLAGDTASLVGFCALLVFMALQPPAGALSDRIGRRPLLTAFGVGSAVGTVPLMTALSHVSGFGEAFLLSLAGLVVVTGYTSISAVVQAELFPTHVRALGVALPYAIAIAIFGGAAAYVGRWAQTGFPWYVAGCAAVSLLAYLTMRETRDIPLSRHERASTEKATRA